MKVRFASVIAAALTVPAALGAGAAADPSLDALGDPVVVTAGDIACEPTKVMRATTCHQAQTAQLLAGADRVLTLGDNQYNVGALPAYQQVYDPTWGLYKSLTMPVPGNHEYGTPGAQGYFDYFGPIAANPSEGYYSYDLGTWHIIALNSGATSVVPTKQGSPQNVWLEQDLAAHRNQCVLAYWHHPRYSAGKYNLGFKWIAGPMWIDLLNAHADVVLNAHDHNYQRWAPMNNDGVPDPTGIRQFIVGTGGRSHYSITTSPVGLETAKSGTFGVLRLTLHPDSYSWEFMSESGGVFADSGTASCV